MVLALAGTAYADVVELDTGERVTGDLKEASLDKVVVEVQGRLVSYDRARVNSASASAEIGRNPIVDRCPSLQHVVEGYPAPTSQENAWRRGVTLEFEIPSIWGCAGEKISEADALATKGAQAPASR